MKFITKKFLIIVLSVISYAFLTFGYANLTDSFSIAGSADVAIPDFDEIAITGITPLSSDITSEDTSIIQPTNLMTSLSGSYGQKVVYKVEAYNYSKTKTFVYAGVKYDATAYPNINKLNIVVSKDANGNDLMTGDASSNVHHGTPITPSEEIVFYVEYTLTDNINLADVLVNFSFKEILYTVTYLNNNQTYAVDYVTDNKNAYKVREDSPSSNQLFVGWVNVNAGVLKTISAGNTYDITLTASWEDIHVIIFADVSGNVLYQEQFTDSSTQLSAEGQATVDRILAELNAEAEKEDMSVSWESYEIKGAKKDITVKAIYAYNGILNLVPVYEEPDDGVADYFKVQAVDTLPENVVVPSSVGGVPIKVIERIANPEGDSDWNNFAESVKTITVGEGIERLEWNSLAYTPNLSTVILPKTIKYMAKNTFSRNSITGDDKKVLTIKFNGTKSDWKVLVSNSDKNWDGGLKKGSKVICTDGYFELTRVPLIGSNTWSEG